jgi:hypothetical protein
VRTISNPAGQAVDELVTSSQAAQV